MRSDDRPAGRTEFVPTARHPREGSPDAYRAAWDGDRAAIVERLGAEYNRLGAETAPTGVWAPRTRRALDGPLRHALLRFEAMGEALGDTPEGACMRLLRWAAKAAWRDYRRKDGARVDLYQKGETVCGTAYEGGTGARQLAENWQRVLEWEAELAREPARDPDWQPDPEKAARWAREDEEERVRRAAEMGEAA